MNKKTTDNSTDTKTWHAPGETASLSRSLLDWYANHRRYLPWREDPSPYHVWLSEIMLQQTRVEAVLGYYDRFLTALPDISTLAKAEEETCLKLWEGLGYYSRVRNLRKAARQVMTEHGGSMPRRSGDLQKLAGIGPYTSAAIASICFGERIPAIDGNLLRVFSRMTGYDQDIKADAAKRAAKDWYLEIFPDAAEGLTGDPDSAGAAPAPNPCGDMNQALMDLGATVCLPNGQPLCGECPWADRCLAHADGRERELPVTPAKNARPVTEKTVFLIYFDQKLALRRRPAKGLLAGLYEFPNAEGKLSRAEAEAYVQTLGFSAIRMRRLPAAKHIFTHREWHMSGWEVLADECDIPAAAPSSLRPEEALTVFLATAAELDEVYPIPSAFARYQAAIRRDYL